MHDIDDELGEDEDEEEEEEETVETFVSNQEFDFKAFVLKFASRSVMMAYGQLFTHYNANSDFINHCIVKMFHRIAWDCQLPALLFHVSIFRVFQRIGRDSKLLSANKSLKELSKFAAFLLAKFFEASKTNKKIFMEICFWKNVKEAVEITEGYGDAGTMTKRQKASFWSEDDEEKLERVFRQLKDMNESGERTDIIDGIMAFFENSGRTSRQVLKKLKTMGLIKVRLRNCLYQPCCRICLSFLNVMCVKCWCLV
jgi:timeless